MQRNITVWRRWGIGILGSWVVVWLAGPWVLDSILVRVQDPALGISTLRSGDVVRWRSEGWAETSIGPHGLPGWQPRQASQRIILWGDSQVEGVCVDDPQKISNQVIAIADRQPMQPLDCLSMGRSGADAREWRDLLEAADALWHPNLHVWVVTELSDLATLAPVIGSELPQRQVVPSPAWVRLAATLRAEAIFAAGKRILRDPESGGLRRLDFRVGPRRTASQGESAEPVADSSHSGGQDLELAQAVAAAIKTLAARFEQRLVIVYAPATPTLARPIATTHPDDAMFELTRDELRSGGVEVVDLRADFIELWQTQRRLPRGFHNGQPGSGHLNADGNRLIAQAIVAIAQQRLTRPADTVAQTAIETARR